MAKKKATKTAQPGRKAEKKPLPFPRTIGLPDKPTFHKHPSPWSHDSLGKPLPPWILDGSVAYVPMISKHKAERA